MEIIEEATPPELTKDEIASLLSLKSSLGNQDIDIATLSDNIEYNIKHLFDDTVNKFTSYKSKYNTNLIRNKINALLSKESILNPDNTRESTHAVYTLASSINTIIKKIVAVTHASDVEGPTFALLSNPDIDQQVVIDGEIVNISDMTPIDIVDNPDIGSELREMMAILTSNDIELQRNINRFIHYISARQHNMSDYELNIPGTAPKLETIIGIYEDKHEVLDFLYSNIEELTKTLWVRSKRHTRLIKNVYLPMFRAGERMFRDDFIK